MYCSNCGSQVKPELHYCNSCGMKLTKAESALEASIENNLSKAIGYIGTFGLIGFIFLIKTILEKDISNGVIISIGIFYLATLFGICAMLLKQISTKKTETSKPEFQSEYMPPQINSANTNQLQEPKQAPASVVENTTRTLGKVPVERN